MRVRFLADANLNQHIVSAILRRAPEIDFKTAGAAALAGLDDVAVLSRAALEGRVLVSHDRSTMPAHFSEFLKQGHSPGVLLIPQDLAVQDAADELLLIWAASEAEEWRDRIVYLPL
jgi:Domain of unknown function (DUF5615)